MNQNNSSLKYNGRNSNIELLRIFAMVMILVYHCFLQLKGDVPDSRAIVFFYTILHNGVPLFLLISGFFSINLSAKKLVSFYLYCVIWALICYGMSMCFAHEPFSVSTCLKLFLPFSHPTVWYPQFYFWLMILSPVLNVFCKNSNLKMHGLVVASLYCMIVYFGLVWQDNVVSGGKSVVYFIYMYLLGAWISHLYNNRSMIQDVRLERLVNLGGGKIALLLSVYVIWVLIMTLILPPSMGRPFRGLVFSYQSPILPITSLLMFFCFLRIKVQQRWINWIAKSVFGIYLMHENSFCSFLYHTNISNIYRDTNGIECFALIALNILAVFVGAIVIDKIMREPVQKYSQKLILTLYTCCKKKANRLVLLRDQ